MTDVSEQPQAPRSSDLMDELVEILKIVVYALTIALVLRVLFFQPFTIPSASMDPTLQEGDYLIVSKGAYGYSRHSIVFSPPIFSGRILGRAPERGDIVVFKLPRDGRTDFVKRLIGLPGDRVQMKAGTVFINDVPVPRRAMPSVTMDSGYGFARSVARYQETLPNGKSYTTYDLGPDGEVDNTQVFVVPEGQYFFLGDNRDNSLDSRFPREIGVGFVPAENLVGKAQIILLSWRRGASLLKPWTWVMNARPERFFQTLQ